MASSTSQWFFKETRLDLEPETVYSTVVLHIPSPATLASRMVSRRQQQQQQQPALASGTEDETTFARDHLASSAALHFRRKDVYPRSLLWRVLRGRKVLALRFVDLTRRPQDGPEATDELRFIFPDPIRPAAISVADDEDDDDVVDVFALTTSNQLYTIPLRSELFQGAGSALTPASVSGRYKSYLSPSFAFRYPYRLVARTSRELVMTLHDGGLLRLTRQAREDGSSWHETFNHDGRWASSLRNLIPWQGSHTVSYGNVSLEESTLASLAFTPAIEEHTHNLLFAVSLDHRLKAWNLRSGRLEFSRDLLNRERQPNDGSRYLVDPTYTNLVAVVDQKPRRDGEICFLVTYSPLGNGQFKFWVVLKAEGSGLALQDLYPAETFEPSPPSADLWALTQFKVLPSEDYGQLELWVLWKNNTSYDVERLCFDLREAGKGWRQPWTRTATEILRTSPLPTVTDHQLTDPTQAWMEYLFYPGRYTQATLRTALSIYARGIHGSTENSAGLPHSLEDSVCSLVASLVTLNQGSSHGVVDDDDHARFQVDTDFQWRRYYRIVSELDNQRGEAISLDYDLPTRMPWIVNADGVTALRHGNDMELIWHNRNHLATGQEDLTRAVVRECLDKRHRADLDKMATFISAATAFSESFSESLSRSCSMALEDEIGHETSDAVPARMRSFYDRCDLEGQIGDDDYHRLAKSLEPVGGFHVVDSPLFESVLRIVMLGSKPPSDDLVLTAFGEKTIVKGAQEIVQLNQHILSSLLYLLVFIDVEETDEGGGFFSERRTPASTIYLQLLRQLREYMVLRWLATTTRSESSKDEQRHDDGGTMMMSDDNPSEPSTSARPGRVSTILQYPWVRNWRPLGLQANMNMSVVLTMNINDALGGIELSNPATYDQQVMWLQRTFLGRGDTYLATRFLRFQPTNAWSAYITARLHISTGNYGMAAVNFKKAAFNLAYGEGRSLSVNNDDDLLEQDDVHYFGSGLTNYYLHIVKLFEKEQVYAYVVELAHVGLQFAATDLTKERETLQGELLDLAFTGYLKIACYDEAYSALLRFTDRSAQRRALTQLITQMSEADEASYLMNFPFLGLHDVVDEILVERCRGVRNIHSSPAYHTILYAWRLKLGDLRGAATALYERLLRLKSSSSSASLAVSSTATTFRADDDSAGAEPGISSLAIPQAYLTLINLLACLDDTDQAWILSSASSTASKSNHQDHHHPSNMTESPSHDQHPKRKLLTLDDLRRQYQLELDHIAAIENDQFSLAVLPRPPSNNDSSFTSPSTPCSTSTPPPQHLQPSSPSSPSIPFGHRGHQDPGGKSHQGRNQSSSVVTGVEGAMEMMDVVDHHLVVVPPP